MDQMRGSSSNVSSSSARKASIGDRTERSKLYAELKNDTSVELGKLKLETQLSQSLAELKSLKQSNIGCPKPIQAIERKAPVQTPPPPAQKLRFKVYEKTELSELPLSMNYATAKTRLRLGEERNPYLCFAWAILSLGLYIPFWMRSVYRELGWYFSNNASLVGFPNFVLLCLPVFQSVYFVRLARYIQILEAQNGMMRTRADVSALLSAFPPFTVLYLQRFLNQQWKQTSIAHINDDL